MRKDWPHVRLEEVLKRVSRATPVEPSAEYKLLGIRLDGKGPFIREVRFGSGLSSNTLYEVKEGDFIYSRLFAWRGAFGVIENELNGCYVSNEFPTFQPINGKIDVRYLNCWFHLRPVLARVEADCSGSTPLTRNRYKEQYFFRLEIPLPPLAEQRRIVEKIERLAGKIEEARRLKNAIKCDHKTMLSALFRDTISNAFCYPLSKVAPLVRRPVAVNMNEDYLELGVRSFGKGTFHKPVLPGSEVGTKKLYWIEPGDLVLNNVFAWEGAIAVATEKDVGRVGSHRFITRVPKADQATPDFICYYLLTPEGIEKIRDASPGGAGRNRTLGLVKLDKILIPVPDIEKQWYFDRVHAKVEYLTDRQDQQAAELDALLHSILDKTFRGETLSS